MSLFEKWSTLDPKKFYAIPFQRLVFLVSLYSEFLENKNKEIKKSWFLVNSRCFCFAYHANLMSDGKKKRLTFLFLTPLILLINFVSISLFRWTVQLVETQKFYVTKTAKLCSIILLSKIIRILSLHRKRKMKHLGFFLRFSITGINSLISGSIKVNIR